MMSVNEKDKKNNINKGDISEWKKWKWIEEMNVDKKIELLKNMTINNGDEMIFI